MLDTAIYSSSLYTYVLPFAKTQLSKYLFSHIIVARDSNPDNLFTICLKGFLDDFINFLNILCSSHPKMQTTRLVAL